METIPTKEQNPKGLHAKYQIKKIVGWKNIGSSINGIKPVTKPVEHGSEYFVLRLDNGGSDSNHINACRKAVLTYANEIEQYIPDLAKDLRERYSNLI